MPRVGYAEVTVSDINADMLRGGRGAGARNGGSAAQAKFVVANAEELPFADESFDAYTIAFGIRNVPRIELALSEAYRVLKRGGRFLCLEFSTVDLPGLDRLYKEWSDRVDPAASGGLVTGDGAALPISDRVASANSRRPARFTAMIEKAGFTRVTHTAMSGNIAALHAAWKL